MLLLAACADEPSLEISVHHLDGYAVKQTLVTEYVGNDVNCSQIEFGDLTAAELAALAIDEVEVASGESLEVSRLGGKSLVARGYDAQHRFVTAAATTSARSRVPPRSGSTPSPRPSSRSTRGRPSGRSASARSWST